MSTRQKALPNDLGAAALKIQTSSPGLSFEEAWDMVEREALPHLRPGETMGMALIRARQTTTVKSPVAPFEVKAREVRSVEPEAEPWPQGRVMLIRGSVGTYVE